MKSSVYRLLLISVVGLMTMNCVNVGAQEDRILVRLETNYGKMKLALYNETPHHRDNFKKLVEEGFYNGLLFHRVIEGFMIQGGDPQSRGAAMDVHLGSGDVGYRLGAEVVFPKYYHKRGALAAARMADVVNPERESSGCQFYIVGGRQCTDVDLDSIEQSINVELQQQLFKKLFEERKQQIAHLKNDTAAYNVELRKEYAACRQLAKEWPQFHYNDSQRREYKMFGGAPHLDAQYTVFGELVEGFGVLDEILKVSTNGADRPLDDVVIISAKIVKR